MSEKLTVCRECNKHPDVNGAKNDFVSCSTPECIWHNCDFTPEAWERLQAASRQSNELAAIVEELREDIIPFQNKPLQLHLERLATSLEAAASGMGVAKVWILTDGTIAKASIAKPTSSDFEMYCYHVPIDGAPGVARCERCECDGTDRENGDGFLCMDCSGAEVNAAVNAASGMGTPGSVWVGVVGENPHSTIEVRVGASEREVADDCEIPFTTWGPFTIGTQPKTSEGENLDWQAVAEDYAGQIINLKNARTAAEWERDQAIHRAEAAEKKVMMPTKSATGNGIAPRKPKPKPPACPSCSTYAGKGGNETRRMEMMDEFWTGPVLLILLLIVIFLWVQRRTDEDE